MSKELRAVIKFTTHCKSCQLVNFILGEKVHTTWVKNASPSLKFKKHVVCLSNSKYFFLKQNSISRNTLKILNVFDASC